MEDKGKSAENRKQVAKSIEEWWPNRLDLRILRQNSIESSPMDKNFDYRKEFRTLNLSEVKKDIADLLSNSQEWWPADFGNYGPLMIRMAWHAAGTYRVGDGRGGAALPADKQLAR